MWLGKRCSGVWKKRNRPSVALEQLLATTEQNFTKTLLSKHSDRYGKSYTTKARTGNWQAKTRSNPVKKASGGTVKSTGNLSSLRKSEGKVDALPSHRERKSFFSPAFQRNAKKSRPHAKLAHEQVKWGFRNVKFVGYCFSSTVVTECG